MLQELYFHKQSTGRSTRLSCGSPPSSTGSPLQQPKALTHFENLKMKVIAIIISGLCKTINTQSSKWGEKPGKVTPKARGETPRAPVYPRPPLQQLGAASTGLSLGSGNSQSPPSTRPTGCSPRSRQPRNRLVGPIC